MIIGHFRLGVEGNNLLSDPLKFDATTSTIVSQIRKVHDCQSINVNALQDITGWRATFNCPTYSQHLRLRIINTGLTGNNINIRVVQHRAPSRAISGTFRLRYNQTWTENIDFNAGYVV